MHKGIEGMRGMCQIPLMCVTLPHHFYVSVSADALQAFLKVLTFANSFFLCTIPLIDFFIWMLGSGRFYEGVMWGICDG